MSIDTKKLREAVEAVPRWRNDMTPAQYREYYAKENHAKTQLFRNASEILAVLEAAYHPADVLQGEVVCCQCGEHPEHPIHVEEEE